MIHLTPAATKAINRFIKAAENPVAGLRIFVSGGGCAGLQYGLRLEQDRSEDDLEFDIGTGAKLLVDPLSSSMLEGLSVDFVDSLTQTAPYCGPVEHHVAPSRPRSIAHPTGSVALCGWCGRAGGSGGSSPPAPSC